MRRESFEKFYFEKVALGEGCGCAEHVTRMRDLDQLASRRGQTSGFGRVISALWRLAAVVRLIPSRRRADEN